MKNTASAFRRNVGNQLPTDAASNARRRDATAVRKVYCHFYISKTDRVAVLELGSQSEETLLCIRKQPFSCGTS
jgi:hypothetical protein